jgi:hypothetical protein
MKKFILLFSMLGILSFFTACSVGYVSEEPVYQTYHRPERPSIEYIWIDGGWKWSNRTHSYIQINGNWEKFRNGHQHTRGHWKKNKHGYHWVRGSKR